MVFPDHERGLDKMLSISLTSFDNGACELLLNWKDWESWKWISVAERHKFSINGPHSFM